MSIRRFTDRTRKDEDLAEEIESHLAHAQDANTARGLSPEEARRRAYVRFGNPRSTRERVWRDRSLPWLEDLWRDLRFALRGLGKTPGFTIIAILVIAVGIGVNTAVFSVINAVLLKPLTYPDPQSLVEMRNTGPQGSFAGANIPKFNIWHQQTSIFNQVAAYDFGGAGLNITGGDHPEQVQGIHVSADYFSLFGAPVVAGRTFTAAEDSPHGGHITVLSYGLWKSRYGADPKVVGTTIQLDGEPYLIVGVIGRGFVTDTPADLWVPFQFDLNSQDMAHYFTVAARLKPGTTLAQVNAQLRLAADEYRHIYGKDSLPPNGGFGVVSLQQATIGDTRFPLLVLLGAVGFVLLIACANVANLLLARASSRKREFATRAALGAGRSQIIRQLLTESLTLSLAGGVLGLLLGFAGVRFLLGINPGNIPRIGEDGSAVTLDIHILLFTLGISLLTGILFGLVPAVSASRSNLAATLNENGSRAGVGFRSDKLRSAFVIGEMALTLVLVIGAALLVRTFFKLQAVDTGFATHNVISMAMSMSGDRFQKTAPVDQVIRDGTDRVLAVPGVLDVGVTNCLPMNNSFGMIFDVVGRPKGNSPFTGGAGFYSISWRYFNALKIPLLRGRSFTEQDDGAAPGVVIINQAMARQYWPKGDPLKDRIQIAPGAGPAFAEGPRQVVGIVGDTHDDGPTRDPFPIMYIPLAQMPDLETALNSRVAPLWWIIRSQADPRTLVPPVTAALRGASGGLPVAHIRTMDEIEARNIARQRFNMLLLTVFGCAGLLMAAIGIYGVMSYSVQQRTQELGVRMALGAQASNLRNMVVRQGMGLTLIGVVIGTGGALWLTRFLASFLFGVKTLDPIAFVAMPFLLSAVALVSIWVPAKRATRVDPMTALRLE
ncbi:ABC transporter permease [Alloacidobacterium sp.]|uniref:ABC transporter permease n=1 Tax=Alloacidobacterium sp. TaxID=2951999 RepID=UPI002D6FB294|nr:ABC transporter permease [Alloacidobacterium sp.]HYK35832.1 ABC transporter permease [Alloacidobacterium sp.]